jgi:hypothetical protein
MDMQQAFRVKAVMNFAADPQDGGRFCNTDSSRSLQKLVAREVEVTDARTLATAPSLDREGFAIVRHALEAPDWDNEDWVEQVYAPSCVELVKRVTGASAAVSFFKPLQRIVDPARRNGRMSPAGFVHIDHPRETGRKIAQMMAAQEGRSFQRAALYNVWKAITPPPQDMPLALADRRTVPASSHVEGITVSDEGETPYVILAPSEETDFYYFSGMTPEESLVFTGVDFDAANPLGCAHSAFLHPDPDFHQVPRASIEARVVAIFD